MSKRPETLETTLLTIELLRRIPRNSRVSAQTLHMQLHDAGFERDIRSIQRLLKALCDNEEFGIELDDSSKPYGYRWKANAKALAVANLSPHESVLLMMAQKHLRNLLPPQLMRSMDGYFRQAQQNLLLDQHAKPEQEWPCKVRVISTSQPLLPPRIEPAIFEAVSEALYANRWLRLEYRNAQGKQAKAHIMPLGLAQRGQVIYLACRFEGYDNERSIALHRIISAETMTLGFERPNDFNLDKYAGDGGFDFGNGERVKLTFRTDADNAFHLAETPLAEDQKIRSIKAGDVEITATVLDSRLLDTWLNGFGDEIWAVKKVMAGRQE